MGRKNKKFIDKRSAHRFVLLHRSQQDPLYHLDGGEGGSKMVLHPADAATERALARLGMPSGVLPYCGPSAQEEGIKSSPLDNDGRRDLREVDAMGLPIDGYDYMQHLALGGGGTFVSKTGDIMDGTSVEERAGATSSFQLPNDMFASKRVLDRHLEAITLRPDSMKPEIRRLLEETDEGDDENEEFEKIDHDDPETLMDDDFMAKLLEADAVASSDVKDEFNFDEHMARLMMDAEVETGELPEEDEEQEMQLSQLRPCRDIDVHFEKLLSAEYGDDEIGELDHWEFDERVAGVVELDSDHLARLVDEHLAEKEAFKLRRFELGATESNRETREDSKKLAFADENENESEPPEEDADAALQEIMTLNGYSTNENPKWDSETIVSTYSTLDNHPTIIEDIHTHRRRRRRRERPIEGDKERPVAHGLFDDMSVSIPPGLVQRPKNETSEEKKVRKKLVKEQQRLRRQEKKATRLMFKDEELRQEELTRKHRSAAAPPKGASVFKFS